MTYWTDTPHSHRRAQVGDTVELLDGIHAGNRGIVTAQTQTGRIRVRESSGEHALHERYSTRVVVPPSPHVALSDVLVSILNPTL